MAPVDPHCHQVTLVDEAQGGHGSGGSSGSGGALGSPGKPDTSKEMKFPSTRPHAFIDSCYIVATCAYSNLQQLMTWKKHEVTSSNPSGKTARDQVQTEDTICICLKKKRPFVLPSCLPCVALIAWHDMLQPPCYTTQLARQFSSLVDSHPVSHTQFIKAPLLMHPHAMPCRSVHFRFVDVL